MGILLSPHCQRLSRHPACLTACSPLSQAAEGPAFSPLGVIIVSLGTHGCLMGGLLSNGWVPKWLSTEHGLRWESAWDCRGDWYCWGGRFGEEGQKPTSRTQREDALYPGVHSWAFTQGSPSCPCTVLIHVVPLWWQRLCISASQNHTFQSPGRPFKVAQYLSVFSSTKLPQALRHAPLLKDVALSTLP